MDIEVDSEVVDHQDPELIQDDVQPMEGVMIGEGPAVQEQDPLKGSYTWELTALSQQPLKVRSDVFEAGGFPWQLLCFPKGNKPNQLSLFLAVPDAEDQPLGWQRSASFKLSLLSTLGPENDLVKDTQHTFLGSENDWGFNTFIALNDLVDPARGFVNNDTIRIRVDITVRVPEDFSYDSRKETGYVGLKNQGATCYMNSLLQTLYNINQFRKAVYHMPTSEDDEPSSSMPLALQGVFYKLQFTEGPVSTKDLTRSFGWDTSDAFQQHDVQELNRILCDRLEEKMKGTRVEGTIARLFEGHTLNYIECINVDYKSSRRESFMDLQLDVKGCATVLDSFERYCEVETLEGDNQYLAEGRGLQDARKGVLFESFPPVLQLQLKRFEYDFVKDAMVKINDCYEFGEELDLDAGGGKFLAASAPRGVRNLYRLLAVLVHSGGVHGGHYYAFVRPDGQRWLKFDDERVETVDADKAVRDNWGGDDDRAAPGGNHGPPGYTPGFKFARFANAYMLVYVRASEWDSIMCGVERRDIPAHVCGRLEAEQKEKERRRKEKAEAHLFTMVRVATDEDLANEIGRTRWFDLVDHEHVRTFKLPRRAPLSALRAELEKATGVPAAAQRLWRWAARQNGTYRPSQPLGPEDDDTQVASLRDGRREARPGTMTTVNLYLETPVRVESSSAGGGGPGGAAAPAAPRPRGKMDVLLFFKQYLPHPTAPSLRYVGSAQVHRHSRVSELTPALAAGAGLPADAALEVYEEIKYDPAVMVEEVRPNARIVDAQLDDGDVLVFQQAVPAEQVEARDPGWAPLAAGGDGAAGTCGEDGEAFAPPGPDAAVQAAASPLLEPPPADAKIPSCLANAPAFFAYVRSCVRVTFRRLDDPGEEGFALELRTDMPYEAVSSAVASRLGLDDPLKLAFTVQNPYSGLPRPLALRWQAAATLADMLRAGSGPGGPGGNAGPLAGRAAAAGSGPVLFYEPLELALPEHERLVNFKVAFHGPKAEELSVHSVHLPRDATVADLLEELRGALPASYGVGAAPMRLMEVYQWRLWQLFDPGEQVGGLAGDAIWHLRAEVVPEDQRDLAVAGDGPAPLHVHCLQVTEEGGAKAFAFSDPFIMSLGEGETVGELRARVRTALGLSEEEAAAWRPLLCPPLAAPEPLADDDVLADRIPRTDLTRLYGHHDRVCLGWQHENKNPRKTHAHMNRGTGWLGQERALKIRA